MLDRRDIRVRTRRGRWLLAAGVLLFFVWPALRPVPAASRSSSQRPDSRGRPAGTRTPEVAPAAPSVRDLAPAGGFLESATTGLARPRLSASVIQAMLPSRGPFRFPAPYNTAALRLTNDTDCAGGGDCVDAVGYSYWHNINNHVGRNEMLILIGLDRQRGGGGPSLFQYDKTTDAISNLGPLFPPSSTLSVRSGEGWYFSATQPTALYVDDGPRMLRVDVLSRTSQVVFDARSQFGPDVIVRQMHSSDDDRVHSATLIESVDFAPLGCVVYHEDTGQFQWFPKIGDFNECALDKSGRYLMSLEDVDQRYDLEMRVFDLATGRERMVWDQAGAVGHADMGYGYVVGEDNWNAYPNAIRLWDFGQDPLAGALVSYNTDWSAPAPNHIAHGNARPGVPAAQQYACGSGASRVDAPWANEIVCFRLDGSFAVLVVAPVMTDLDAAGGGDDYTKMPKGNLDVTGEYFIWTSNMGGGRLDAFLVKVPSQVLVAAPPPPAGTTPPTLAIAAAPDPVLAGGTISYTLSYANRGTTTLTAAEIRDRVPADTRFVSATAGGVFSNNVVTWSLGTLSPGATGTVRLVVRVASPLPPGVTIFNGAAFIDSRETAPEAADRVTTQVVGSLPPAIDGAVESGSHSIFVTRGAALTLRISGTNLQAGATVDLGPDVAAGTSVLSGPGDLLVPISVRGTAALGMRTLIVTNPDGFSGSKPEALELVKSVDIVHDCRLDATDLNALARAWNTIASEPGFQEPADLDGDNYVGPLDLTILAEYFGQRLKECD